MKKEYAQFEPVKGIKAIAGTYIGPDGTVTVCAPTAGEVTAALVALSGIDFDESKYQRVLIISATHIE